MKRSATHESSGRSVLSDVASAKFGLLWLMIVSSAVSGLNIASSYKTYGIKQAALNSDAFLSLVGSLAAIFGNAAVRDAVPRPADHPDDRPSLPSTTHTSERLNSDADPEVALDPRPLLLGLARLTLTSPPPLPLPLTQGRFFWGSLSDSAGFKGPYLALTLIQGLTMLAYRRLAATRLGFTLATIAVLFCMGGNFAIFPAHTFRMFGNNGAGVYSFLFTGFGLAALLGPVLSNALLSKGGYPLVYNVLGALSFVSLLLSRLL